MKATPVFRGSLIFGLVFLTGTVAQGQENTSPPSQEVQALRKEIEILKEQLRRLEARVALLSEAQADIRPSAPPPSKFPPVAASPPPTAPTSNLLNPAIAANFLIIGNSSLRGKDEVNGFDLSEAEIAFQSVVDPYARVDLYLSFPADESPEIEEGVISTTALPGSLQLRGGRFKNAFGKWNPLHSHAYFTVEKPDPLLHYFGEESLTTDGLSLSWLIPNPWDFYLESITEVGTAREGPSFNSVTRDLTWMEHVKTFFDLSADSTLEVGVSMSGGRTGASEFLEESIESAGLSLEPREELNSRVAGMDVTYRWKPLQKNVYRSLLWQSEILRSHRDVDTLTPGGTLEPDTINSLGGYTYLEWQVARRWRTGLRYDIAGLPDSETAREVSTSGVLRFHPSEFHEVRFQIKHSDRNEEAALRLDGDKDDTRIFIEWIPVIGSHGAHKY